MYITPKQIESPSCSHFKLVKFASTPEQPGPSSSICLRLYAHEPNLYTLTLPRTVNTENKVVRVVCLCTVFCKQIDLQNLTSRETIAFKVMYRGTPQKDIHQIEKSAYNNMSF